MLRASSLGLSFPLPTIFALHQCRRLYGVRSKLDRARNGRSVATMSAAFQSTLSHRSEHENDGKVRDVAATTSLSSSQWGWYSPYVSCLPGNCGQHARIWATWTDSRRRCQHSGQRPDCRVFITHGRGTEASEYQPRNTLPIVVDSSCFWANSEEHSSHKASRDIQFSPPSSHGTHLRTPSRIPTARITREYGGAPFLGDNHRRECRHFGSSRALSRGYRRKSDGPVASAR